MKRHSKKQGFTIVELLTVMSVIAILIGLLVPALNLVRKMAKDTKQKAQFHSITVALEIYNGEQEAYPDSAVLPSGGSAPYTVGAQRLAEALVGRDLLGYDPASTWDAKADEGDSGIYASEGPPKNSDYTTEVTPSLARRKGPYLNPENVEAYQIGQLYTNTGDVYPGNLANDGTRDTTASPAPVLTDAYRVKTVTVGGRQVKAGSPILYYKANTSSKEFPDLATTNISNTGLNGTKTSIFNSMDNEDLIDLGQLTKPEPHHFNYIGTVTSQYKEGNKDGRRLFYDAITNPKITSMTRPYNQSSYILISAGYDGIYGTKDDIFNFNE
ncbi:MAG: prepilin-type N-terminal cleavage/methylation domain-containing protein [Planctomycetes bacterium]|nr:prepilin-type N-terminal cleavage/methylation domain-containing protein [Planctomycetota bacterium]